MVKGTEHIPVLLEQFSRSHMSPFRLIPFLCHSPRERPVNASGISGTGVSVLREALIPLECCLPRAQAAGGCSVFLSVVLISFGHETQRKELDILMSFFHHPEMNVCFLKFSNAFLLRRA